MDDKLVRNKLEINNDDNHYYIFDSVTKEVLYRYSKDGFSLSRVEWFLEKFNSNLDKIWERKNLTSINLYNKNG